MIISMSKLRCYRQPGNVPSISSTLLMVVTLLQNRSILGSFKRLVISPSHESNRKRDATNSQTYF